MQTQHIRVFQGFSNDPAGVLLRLSTQDFYLDLNTGLPDATAFKAHPDSDLNVDIDTEIIFADYQTISGVLVPSHFQRTVNGSVVLDATVTSVAENQGLPDALFSLQ